MYGESLLGRRVSLDVALARSLGTRPLLEASTGEVVPASSGGQTTRCPPRQWARLSRDGLTPPRASAVHASESCRGRGQQQNWRTVEY
jgi:hypothetical protein